jgi:hypothetical protein
VCFLFISKRGIYIFFLNIIFLFFFLFYRTTMSSISFTSGDIQANTFRATRAQIKDVIAENLIVDDVSVALINGNRPVPYNGLRLGIPVGSGGASGGVYVTSAESQPTGFALPLTLMPDEGLGLGSSFAVDPANNVSIIEGNKIQFNNEGVYLVTFVTAIGVNGGSPGDPPTPFTAGNQISVQLLEGDMFASAPITSGGCPVFSTGTTPLSVIYSGAAFISSSMTCNVTVPGTIVKLKLYIQNDYCEVFLTSGVSITKLV